MEGRAAPESAAPGACPGRPGRQPPPRVGGLPWAPRRRAAQLRQAVAGSLGRLRRSGPRTAPR
eukprot:6947225-Pyramimonas_sp.AAC.1